MIILHEKIFKNVVIIKKGNQYNVYDNMTYNYTRKFLKNVVIIKKRKLIMFMRVGDEIVPLQCCTKTD